MSILVVLELEAVEGKADDMIGVLRRHLGDTRARPGCEGVTVHQDQDRPTSIVLVERWATRADDDAYRAWRAGEGAWMTTPLAAGGLLELPDIGITIPVDDLYEGVTFEG